MHQRLNWQNPYPSARSPVFASNVVATSQPLATQAGLRAMQAGGNAVDAALASAITLTVVEPNNNGIGSDAFAIIWDGSQLHGLNGSGRAPAAWSPEYFAGRSTMPTLGWDAVTVPGAVSAWVAMSERFGRLPFAQLFEDAIGYARNGYQVGPKSAFYWQLAPQRYADYPEFLQTFCPQGRAPRAGELVTLPDHARSLELICGSHGRAFYKGVLADAMVKASRQAGGVLSNADLASHQANWVDTLSQSFADTQLHEIPPNGQGLLALMALGIVKHLPLAEVAVDSAESVHWQIEACRIAYADVERHLADITSMRVTPQMLLDPDYLKSRAESINNSVANITPTALGASADTVYLSTADASGMMVSMIQSNFRGFGSGIVPAGTGISLQNRGSGFTLETGHPNQVAGGKRPYHTIIPGFVMTNGQPLMSFGVMGGHMQAQGHLQMMVRIVLHGQNPQAACDAPRWYLQEDGSVCLEAGFSAAVQQQLVNLGHPISGARDEHLFGGAQLIYKLDQGYCGASDHRKEGQAGGF
ncbi:MAG: gamma-glutamyltranspeptidase/glutathione hydrolase [Candidatus Pseudothioglobus sp.]|jgi:gamma-glutamyltranspeptidase/glutathione hydrolase